MATDLVEDRGDETYVARIRDITVTPSFPEPGKPLRCDLTAELTEQVDLTQVVCQFQVKIGIVTLIRKTFTLPDLLKQFGAELTGDLRPAAGEWKQSWTFNLPREVPKGDFRLYLQSFTEDDKDFCDLFIHADLRPRR
ncbi:ML domain-containing protein [Streptoalloteichus hindustanus]|uniref:Uncharacterized protein n=1 Tax=Streptoalloteichus hindustanus TaxID=2017 RepID=A0A1M5I1V9_STRHI|nr:hypothetical protein [Streptoalloteichus hindustanus]SHG22271.1 hypothetical protein SAMN05444320_10764 [Streptoalloteichus hindustanus]